MTFLWAAVAALLVALLPMPYDGYVFVKWVVTVSCVVAAYRLSQGRKFAFHGWTCIAIAGLYNPLVPFHLNRGLWMVLDLAVAGLLVVVIRSTSTAQAPTAQVFEQPLRSTTLSADPSQSSTPPVAPNPLQRSTRNGGDDFARSILRTSLFGLALLAIVVFLLKR